MTKAIHRAGLFLLFPLFIACGGGDDADPCADAAELFAAAEADFCAEETADCMYCDCLTQGLILNTESGNCQQPTEADPVVCEGLVQAAAEACLADETACQQDARDLARQTCQTEYLQLDCESDADCKYGTVCTDSTCSLP